MLRVQYASRTSAGSLAGQIGWVNFGPNFLLNPSQSPVTVCNYISRGYMITFRISTSAVITPNTYPIPPIVATTSPSFANMPFGTNAYTGIGGYPILVMQQNPNSTTGINYTIQISDISVTDCCGCPVTNYILYAADAEVTNLTTSGSPEIWQATTDGGNWNIVQQIPSYDNTLTGPIVTGIGTNVVTETGTATSTSATSSYVYSTVSPDNLTAFLSTFGGNQAFALGIIITPGARTLLLSSNCCVCANLISSSLSQTFSVPSGYQMETLTYNGTTYNISSTATVITGALATYSVTSDGIIVTPIIGTTPVATTDIFTITYSKLCGCEIIQCAGSLVFAEAVTA